MLSFLSGPKPLATPAPPAGAPDPAHWRVAALLLGAAFALRAVQFGNPVIQVDEQFYLLVGDRMLHGAVPFVDAWDRKPAGLFALYALIRLLGGQGIVQYQIVATLFAAATAMVIVRLAWRVAPGRGAVLSGLVYLVYLMFNGGDGGQAPVFYDLPVALAGLAAMRAVGRDRFDGGALGWASLSMALFGVAMQIKYSPLFEGIYVGLFLLGTAWRGGRSLPALAGMAVLWCALALAPTALVAAIYWRLGYLPQFFFANFLSILMRPAVAGVNVASRLGKIVLHLAPVAVPAVLACHGTWRLGGAKTFVAGWAASAVAGLLVFGTFHDHYALPLLVPLSVAAAPVLAATMRVGRRRIGIGAIVIGLGIAVSAVTIAGLRMSRGNGRAVSAAAALIRADPPTTMFVFSGDPVAYLLARAPLPTPYAFPTFLREEREASSLGVDQMTELRRTMATRPRYVITRAEAPRDRDQATWAYMRAELARHYALAFTAPEGNSTLLLYRRRSGDAGAGAGERGRVGGSPPRTRWGR